MKMMDQRIKTYHESLETCAEDVASPDDGLFIDVGNNALCYKSTNVTDKIPFDFNVFLNDLTI